jgi:hypothetical protein
MDRSRFKELIIVQLNKKCPAFYVPMQLTVVHYCGHYSSIQSHVNRPRHVVISLELHFNIILPSSHCLSTGLLPSGFPNEISFNPYPANVANMVSS